MRCRQVKNYDTAYELYSDETLAQDDKAFFMKVADTVRCAVDESKFMLTVVNPKIVQERLGHSSIKVTMDTYSHVLSDMQKQSVEALGKLFG